MSRYGEAMKRIAIVGCGDVASVHLDAIADQPGVELVAVCDRDAEVLLDAVERLGVRGFRDHGAMLRDVALDAVHICTPHNQHHQIAIDALDAGVNVLLEKPLADDLDHGDELVAAAERSSAKIGVCFQNRYNPTSVRLKQELESGRFGVILGARAQVMWTRTADYYQAKPWRGTWDGSGGGLLMNQAIHTVDLVQWLVGEVDAITGVTATLMFGDVIEVEDTAVAVFEHANGVRTNFYATLTHFTNAPVLIEITCEQGVLRLEGDLRAVHPDGSTEVLEAADVVHTARNYWGASHSRLIADFYARLDDPEPFWIDAEEAFKSLDIVQSLYAS